MCSITRISGKNEETKSVKTDVETRMCVVTLPYRESNKLPLETDPHIHMCIRVGQKKVGPVIP